MKDMTEHLRTKKLHSMHLQDDTVFSNSSGTLSLVNESQINGSDVLGSFTGKEMTWSPLENFFFTSYRTYVTQDGGIADVIVFKQEFRNQDQVRIRSLRVSFIFRSLVE